MNYELIVTFRGTDPLNTIHAQCDSIVVDGDIADLLVGGIVAWSVKCRGIVSIRLTKVGEGK